MIVLIYIFFVLGNDFISLRKMKVFKPTNLKDITFAEFLNDNKKKKCNKPIKTVKQLSNLKFIV